MKKKPYLFLDVDGVLNRIKPFSEIDTYFDFKEHRLRPFNQMTYTLWLSREMAFDLMSLPVDIVWLTTWAEEAPRLVAPALAMPEYPVAGFGTDMTNGRASKLGCVYWWLDNHGKRPFVWIDDDAIPAMCADFFKEEDYEALLIEPDLFTGITKDHIKEIAEFCG